MCLVQLDSNFCTSILSQALVRSSNFRTQLCIKWIVDECQSSQGYPLPIEWSSRLTDMFEPLVPYEKSRVPVLHCVELILRSGLPDRKHVRFTAWDRQKRLEAWSEVAKTSLTFPEVQIGFKISLEEIGKQEFQCVACFWRRNKSVYGCLFQTCSNTRLEANFRLYLL